MERALYISMILYFPLLATAAAVFTGDLGIQSLGGPLFKTLSLAWMADGFATLVFGIIIIKRAAQGGFEPRSAWTKAVLSLAAIIMGIPPAYLLLELAYKLLYYSG